MERSERLRLAVLYWTGFIAVLTALAFVIFIITGLQDDLRDANKARNALVDQVRGLGATPVVGPAGKNGAKGEPGTNGKDGSNGQPGANGINGKDGSDGTDGKDGAAGSSGKDGANGKDGATGPQGPQGDKGDAGATGPQGPPGEKGNDGQTCPEGYSLGTAILGNRNALVCIQDQTFGKG